MLYTKNEELIKMREQLLKFVERVSSDSGNRTQAEIEILPAIAEMLHDGC